MQVLIEGKTWNVVAKHEYYWLVALDKGVYPLHVFAMPAPPELPALDVDEVNVEEPEEPAPKKSRKKKEK